MNKLGGVWVLVIVFLHPDRSPNALHWFSGGIFIPIALPLDLVLELVAKDATVQNCLNLVVLLIIHNDW